MQAPALQVDYRGALMKAALACGGGIGMTIAWFAIKFITVDPKLAADVVKTVLGWGPLSLIAIVGVVQADIRARESMRVQAEAARAQQALADAVTQIAAKDDRESEERRRQLNYIGAQQEKILERLDAMRPSQAEAKGASA
ncbi:hypothetical protein Acid345_3403 [Candidatus Koribacter versatilis Ellin345]|uniref:Uncharacterized protein n=1 Tax=Koribacter versatilis (strain Ellin345) TaxID=204669 RepID=Q1IL46_KORVE|nr:hypothetical protein [Candidatus Koribacter versatilis]ABF42404.1 hypothetical protein Acid345_3403 [Candidatus Koribacter versatilis Ellin345]